MWKILVKAEKHFYKMGAEYVALTKVDHEWCLIVYSLPNKSDQITDYGSICVKYDTLTKIESSVIIDLITPKQ